MIQVTGLDVQRKCGEMLKSVSDEKMREIIEEIAEGYERIAKGIARKQNGPIKH